MCFDDFSRFFFSPSGNLTDEIGSQEALEFKKRSLLRTLIQVIRVSAVSQFFPAKS